MMIVDLLYECCGVRTVQRIQAGEQEKPIYCSRCKIRHFPRDRFPIEEGDDGEPEKDSNA